jgi:hypothetical protein
MIDLVQENTRAKPCWYTWALHGLRIQPGKDPLVRSNGRAKRRGESGNWHL